jgi:D-sedoheptulose 7-phosphate isomerase
MLDFVSGELNKSSDLVAKLVADKAMQQTLVDISKKIEATLRANGKVLLAGNGGSAADCQHIAGEFVSRFNYDRPGLSAIAMTTDTSILTAIGNDYGYERLFSRQIQALGHKGDVFIAISTSGNSKNILAAIHEAKRIGLFIVGLTGQAGGAMRDLCDVCLCMPSPETPKIQEGHIMVSHIICGVVEMLMFPPEQFVKK